MGKSFKKNPFVGNTMKDSDKEDKKRISKKTRRANKNILARYQEGDEFLDTKELGGPWSMSKDGKHRIDPEESPKYIRK
jgi:hypothetical protein